MKKIFFIAVSILPLLLLIKPKEEKINKQEEFRGIFISYIEISKYLKDKNEELAKENIIMMIEKIKELKFNSIIFQVRPSSDAMYYSKIFPISKYLSDNGNYPFDVLKFFIEESHKRNINLIAWVNPYRVSTTQDIEKIEKNNPAYKYINTDILYINNGIYYNPSKKETNKIIIDGIKELLEYKIDGILFDDYFYPGNDVDIDDYNKYKEKTKNTITLKEYHLMIINNMIKEVHKVCKKSNIEFGVSPDGNIENNYNSNFADVRSWLSSNEYVDFIMPQIYYGFYNENKPFIKTINEWSNLVTNKQIEFIPALAFYKSGQEDKYALSGKYEWIENKDIIMREIIIARNIKNCNGFSLYRYDSLFIENNIDELSNVKRIVK